VYEQSPGCSIPYATAVKTTLPCLNQFLLPEMTETIA
jgi:hypothetical protein